jgi:hypothetical protein
MFYNAQMNVGAVSIIEIFAHSSLNTKSQVTAERGVPGKLLESSWKVWKSSQILLALPKIK